MIDGETKLRVITLYARKMFKNGGLIQPQTEVLDIKTAVRNKCFAVFQKIDMFGYMTDITWFIEENVKTLKAFYKKLALQWNLEFGLNNTARYRIAQNHNLFSNSLSP